jgi:hypothetical protein
MTQSIAGVRQKLDIKCESRATMNKAFFAFACMLVVALSGCSSKVTTGQIQDMHHTQPFHGAATNVYQPFTGANPLSGSPVGDPSGKNLQCAQDNSTVADPTGTLHHCKGPYTVISANFTDLPLPDAAGWALWLVNATGSMQVGPLVAGNASIPSMPNTGAFQVSHNFSVDYTNQFTTLELRLGNFVYATAPAAVAIQQFVPAAGLSGVRATGGYDSHKLTVEVSGLPANSTYTGYLYPYQADGKTPSTTPTESFPVQNGPNSYESPTHAISDFAQFHIHVGTSKLNLFKSTILPPGAVASSGGAVAAH